MGKNIVIVMLFMMFVSVDVSATSYNSCQQIESANTSDTLYVYEYYDNGCISKKTATTGGVNDNKYEITIQDTFYNEDGALSYTNLYVYTPFEQTQDPTTVDYVSLLTTYYPPNTFEMLEGNNASYSLETYYEDNNTLIYGDSEVVSDTEIQYYENSNMYDTITINDYANNTQTNYKYDKNGYIDYTNTYYLDGEVVTRSVETTYYDKYDSDGNQIIKQNIDTYFNGEIATKQYVNTYYENGLIKVEEYREFNSDTSVSYEKFTTHNEDNTIAKEEEINYDANGVITDYKMLEYTNELLTQEYSSVYVTGLIQSDTTINYNNEIIESKVVCQYSNEIKTKCTEEIYENGVVVSKIEYIYDASGNVVDKIVLIPNETTTTSSEVISDDAVDNTNTKQSTSEVEGETVTSYAFGNTGSYKRLIVLSMIFLVIGIYMVVKKCRQKS